MASAIGAWLQLITLCNVSADVRMSAVLRARWLTWTCWEWGAPLHDGLYTVCNLTVIYLQC